MSELVLPALHGTNPLGLLAALGALDALDHQLPHIRSGLSWTDHIVPAAVLHGVDHHDQLLELLDADRRHWQQSPVLTFAPDGHPPQTLRLPPPVVRQWIATVAADPSPVGRRSLRLLTALVAEGATAGTGEAKPTHLDFTAGQQRFLHMARTLAGAVDADRLAEAVSGPWRYDSVLPSFGWDNRGDRIYAVRATNPSKDKRTSVPGAEWLAFVGLAYFPVWDEGGKLRTTACDRRWKRSGLTWPLWRQPLTAAVVRSLLRDRSLRHAPTDQLQLRGVTTVLRSPIRRTDQGGYGSFGGAEPVTPAAGGGGPSALLRPAGNPRRSGQAAG